MRTNWAGNHVYRASALRHAGSVAELQEMVRAAPRVRILGTRHSFNDIADTDGLQIALDRLERVIAIDPDRRHVTVDGGIRYGDLAPALQAQGWALANLASLPHISVAGAVATATHGSGSAIGNLATAVAALDIVTAQGEIVRVARDSDPEGLAGAVVGLGALGAVVGLTLDIEPAYQIRQTVYTGLPFAVLDADFEAVFASGTSVSVFTDWRGDRAQAVWVKDRVTADSPQPPEALFGAPPAAGPLHPLPGGPAANCTEQMGSPGPWHERLPHFRMDFTPSNGAEIQAEYFLPRDAAGPAIAALRRLGDRLAGVLMVSEIRSVAADALWLSPSRGEPYFGIHFTFHRDAEAVRAALPEIEAALAGLDPVPHWGKVSTLPAEAIAARFPRLPDFRGLLDRHDPAGKFRNALVGRIVFGAA